MTTEMDFSGPVMADMNPPIEDLDDPIDDIPEGPICETCDKIIIREPGKRGRMPKYHPECRPSTKKATGTRKKTKKPPGVPDYEEGLNGIFQLVAFGLNIAGERNKALLADGMAVAQHGPNIAAALNQLASEKPEVAAVLDRVLAAGPYGVIIAATAPLFMQLAANHGAPVPGFLSGDAYLQQFIPVENKAA